MRCVSGKGAVDMRIEHEQWLANKDGNRFKVNGPDELIGELLKVYRDAGYVITKEEYWWDTEGGGTS